MKIGEEFFVLKRVKVRCRERWPGLGLKVPCCSGSRPWRVINHSDEANALTCAQDDHH